MKGGIWVTIYLELAGMKFRFYYHSQRAASRMVCKLILPYKRYCLNMWIHGTLYGPILKICFSGFLLREKKLPAGLCDLVPKRLNMIHHSIGHLGFYSNIVKVVVIC